jgi:hypothetical protein
MSVVKLWHGVRFMPSVIYGMLKEEKERNLELQELYSKEIESLPKGSIIVKNISGNDYYYLKYWSNNKANMDYLGKDEDYVEKIRVETKRRKHLQGVVKRLKSEYKEICKVVKD